MPPLTAQQAASVHELFLRHTLDRLAAAQGAGIGSVVLCYDPPDADPVGWTKGQVAVHPQSAGDLGERLTAAMRALGADRPVLFLGCDSPDLPAGHLAQATTALAEGAQLVLGPCEDGGFWCLGVAAGLDLRPALAGVAWSSGQELAQVRRNAAAAGLSVALVCGWTDVDRPADLANLLVRLRTAGGQDPLLRRLEELGLDALPGVAPADPSPAAAPPATVGN